MKKALTASLGTAAALFLAVASTNYSALGDAVPDSVLDAGYPHAPDWVPLVANVMIALHMVSAFQVRGFSVQSLRFGAQGCMF